ncbi:aminotransferase class I/II-fold pyridoxal phosphate-dependent enzyme [Sphingobacterium wenxiniae]|uniref:7-keto-8-aminopelargonate synthetase n=1 Tax=Sphingobacterium wenxiniae TaxID=683125 RepID=A0A1I6S4I5_9SPHI|nr:aminotransferase class I/II-fold pyridoxal phosphate-dependent enzyme [Sphingobacterium wenxiniae]SFS71867.1 7-keto-8-aminopelargonate synthetase [Sphingobacterium wenxiniae]
MDLFRDLHQPTGRIIHQSEKDYLFFGGTSYLGLPTNQDYIALFKEGIDKYGLNNGTSRSNNVQQGIYDLAERNMALRFGFEEALLVSSGYLAAQLAVRQLQALGEMLYAPGTHPALWLENEVPYSVESFEDWATRTVNYINHSDRDDFIVVSNTLDNLTPQRFDFSPFKQLAPYKKVYLLLDDSHGIGIAVPNRCYVDREALNIPQVELLVVASLAKGMATDAGVILCSASMAALLKPSPFFRGASPPAPTALHALVAGERIYQDAVAMLHNNIDYLRARVSDTVNYLSDFAVFTIAKETAFADFLKRGILISSFSYPLPNDPPINRIVLSAHHRQEDLDRLLEVVNSL